MKEQPEYHIDEFGHKLWYLPSKGKQYFHKENGPAVELSNGTKQWWLNGELHRLSGPAVEGGDGHLAWFVKGRSHRLDGPAVIWESGHRDWMIEGKKLLTEEIEDWLEENVVDLTTEEGQMAFKLRWI